MQLLRLLHCIIILRSSTKHFILFMDHILAKCYLVGTHGYGNPGSSLLCTERLQVLFLDTEIVHTIKSLTMTKSHTHFEFDSYVILVQIKMEGQTKKDKKKCISFQNNKFRFVHKGKQSYSLFDSHTTPVRRDVHVCQDSECISKSQYLQQRQDQTCIRC